MSKRVADTYSHLDHTMTSIDGKGTLKPLGKLRLTEERLHALDSSIAALPVAADRRGDMDRDIISRSHTAASSHRDLFFNRSAFDHHHHHHHQQQQSISAQTPFQLLQLNAVVVDPERIAQTAMVRSKQERERRKAKVQASSKVLANMLKPAVACAT
jgi:G3E family GTPase